MEHHSDHHHDHHVGSTEHLNKVFYIGIVIIITTWGLVKESIRLVIDAVPRGIDTQKIIEKLQLIEHVTSVQHVHIWALSSQINALSAHIQVAANAVVQWENIKAEMKHLLEHENIVHATLELETLDECHSEGC